MVQCRGSGAARCGNGCRRRGPCHRGQAAAAAIRPILRRGSPRGRLARCARRPPARRPSRSRRHPRGAFSLFGGKARRRLGGGHRKLRSGGEGRCARQDHGAVPGSGGRHLRPLGRRRRHDLRRQLAEGQGVSDRGQCGGGQGRDLLRSAADVHLGALARERRRAARRDRHRRQALSRRRCRPGQGALRRGRHAPEVALVASRRRRHGGHGEPGADSARRGRRSRTDALRHRRPRGGGVCGGPGRHVVRGGDGLGGRAAGSRSARHASGLQRAGADARACRGGAGGDGDGLGFGAGRSEQEPAQRDRAHRRERRGREPVVVHRRHRLQPCLAPRTALGGHRARRAPLQLQRGERQDGARKGCRRAPDHGAAERRRAADSRHHQRGGDLPVGGRARAAGHLHQPSPGRRSGRAFRRAALARRDAARHGAPLFLSQRHQRRARPHLVGLERGQRRA